MTGRAAGIASTTIGSTITVAAAKGICSALGILPIGADADEYGLEYSGFVAIFSVERVIFLSICPNLNYVEKILQYVLFKQQSDGAYMFVLVLKCFQFSNNNFSGLSLIRQIRD